MPVQEQTPRTFRRRGQSRSVHSKRQMQVVNPTYSASLEPEATNSSSERSERLRFPVGLLMRSNSIGRVLGCYPRDGGSNPPFAAIVSRDLSPATVGGWECGEQRQVSGRNPACAGCAVVTRGDVESRRSLTGDARLSGCPGIHPAHVGNPESYLPLLARREHSVRIRVFPQRGLRTWCSWQHVRLPTSRHGLGSRRPFDSSLGMNEGCTRHLRRRSLNDQATWACCEG